MRELTIREALECEDSTGGLYLYLYRDRGERWDFLERHIAEHLDLVNEQARIVRWLREL